MLKLVETSRTGQTKEEMSPEFGLCLMFQRLPEPFIFGQMNGALVPESSLVRGTREGASWLTREASATSTVCCCSVVGGRTGNFRGEEAHSA